MDRGDQDDRDTGYDRTKLIPEVTREVRSDASGLQAIYKKNPVAACKDCDTSAIKVGMMRRYIQLTLFNIAPGVSSMYAVLLYVSYRAAAAAGAQANAS